MKHNDEVVRMESAQNVVGQQIKEFQGRAALVVGVVKNFNYHPLKEDIKNQAFITSRDKGYNHFYIRIAAGNPSSSLAAIQKTWSDIIPGIPMKYSFLDEDISNAIALAEPQVEQYCGMGRWNFYFSCLPRAAGIGFTCSC